MKLNWRWCGAMVVWSGCAMALPVVLTGCGSKNDTNVADGGEEDPDDSEATPTKTGTKKKTTTKKKNPGPPAPDVKRIDGIPYDVFFDKPFEVAADSRTGGAPAVAKTDAPMPDAPKGDSAKPTETAKPATETAKPAAGGGGWDKVVSVEELLDAVKGTRAELDKRLGNVQAYNSAQLEVPVFGTELTLLAEIARQHPGEIRWKEKAKVIRTLAIDITKVASSAEARGKKSFDAINAAFTTIKELLDGNSPPGLPEAPDTVSFEETINIKYLMKRLDRVETNLKTNTATEDGFGKNAAGAQREVVIAALMAQGIQEKTYGYDSEEDYNKHALGMKEAARGMTKAIADKNFTEYDNLRNQVSQRCSECHMIYRTGK